MAEIATRYESSRNAILMAIREGRVSASMSGIEYCDKPWGELDMSDDGDMQTISTALTWDGEGHDCDPLERRSDAKLALLAERMQFMYEPTPERHAKIAALDEQIRRTK